MTPKDVAEAEKMSLKSLYNILYSMRDCPKKVWRGWVFEKRRKYWHCEKLDEARS